MDADLDTDMLRTRMRAAARDVQPSAGFADTVTRSARRRKLRRRSAMAGVAALTALAALAAGAAVVLAPEPEPAGPGPVLDLSPDPRLDQPTRGDLAADQDFLARTRRAWEEGLPRSYNFDRGIFDDRRGQPHVYWAGNTPSGPAAVVLQRAYLHQHGNLSPTDWNEWQTLVGLVGTDPADGQLKLLVDQYQPDGSPAPGAFLFGRDDRTLLVVDHGIPMFVSPGPVVDTNGRTSRSWQPLRFTDGVAVLQLPEGTDADEVRIHLRNAPDPGQDDFANLMHPAFASEYLEYARLGPGGMQRQMEDRRLQWNDERARPMRVGAERPVPQDLGTEFSTALEQAGFTDPLAGSGAESMWFVVAGLSDGRTAIVGERQEGEQPSRLFAVIKGADGSVQTVLPSGTVDPNALLPVRIRMPDAQGWVVAAYGALLSYRLPDGPWIDAGRDAALLPDAARYVMVAQTGRQPSTVELAR